MKNNSLKEIADVLEQAERILFLTHVIVDGDAAGSAAALCRAMTARGKIAHIFAGEALPNNLRILDYEGFLREESELLEDYDVAVAIDCSDRDRFEKRSLHYNNSRVKINLDHHKTNDYYADYNYVDPEACAAGEIVYRLICEAGWETDPKIAEAIYVAIVTDSGQFQYSTTTAETHRIAAALMEAGIDLNAISVAVYQSNRKEKYLLQGEILRTLELREEGRFALAYSDLGMYERTGSTVQDSDGMVEMLRDIDTVEVACFAKETAPGVMKVGFRSKYNVDVAELAMKFGGGGHVKASGCTVPGSIEDVRKEIFPEIRRIFSEKE